LSGGAVALAEQDTKTLLNRLPARAHARALVGACAVGVSLSVVLAGAYVAGGAARAGTEHAHFKQLASAAASGFGDHTARSGTPGDVLAIAKRFDPAAVPVALDGASPWAHALPAPQDGASALVQKAAVGVAAAATPFQGRTNASDEDCLATAVYYEARGEGQAGQQAVAQVILNRVRNPAYPKTICGVVYQAANGDCQFSFVCNGAMRGRRESAAWSRARRVADRALGGFVMSDIGNAVNFHAARVAPGWSGMIRVAQVGQHVFYGFGGRSTVVRSFPSSAPHAPALLRVAQVQAPVQTGYKVLGPDAHRDEPKLILASASLAASTPQHAAPAAQPKVEPAPLAVTPAATPALAAAKTVVLASAS